MNNECLCSVCGTLTRLDDVRYLNDNPICSKCQIAITLEHDCTNSPEDGCEVCATLMNGGE